jgi:hypothetical protein
MTPPTLKPNIGKDIHQEAPVGHNAKTQTSAAKSSAQDVKNEKDIGYSEYERSTTTEKQSISEDNSEQAASSQFFSYFLTR